MSLAELLVNTSTKLFVDNPDEFLAIFDENYFSNQDLINQIIQRLNGNDVTRIGEASAAGQIFLIGNWVVKVTYLCPPDIGTKSSYLQIICRQSQSGDIIFRVPSSYNNKLLLSAPAYITESLVSIILSSKKLRVYTDGFPHSPGFQYDKNNKAVFTVMELLQPLYPKLKNNTTSSVLQMFFQVSWALNAAQKMFKFTHYDLHAGNVMTRAKSPDQMLVYSLGNGDNMYIMSDFECVIIDFGLSRLETDKVMVISSSNFGPTGRKDVPNYQPDAMNFYEYNPYVDLFEFFNFIFNQIETRENLNIDPRLKRVLNIDYYKLNVNGLSERQIDDLIEATKNRILMGTWRANPSEIAKLDVANDIHPPCTPYEFMLKICDRVKAIQKEDNTPNDKISHFNRLRTIGVLVSNEIINYNNNMKIYPPVKEQPNMDTTFYPTVLSRGSGTKFDSIEIEQEITIEGVYIHKVIINQKLALAEGYKFNFDCCRTDIRSLMRSKNIKSGVAINASFFQIKGDFTPVGYYRTEEMTSDNQLDPMYSKFFAKLGITRRNGYLDISRDSDDMEKYDQVITSGPLLVWNGTALLNKENIEQLDNNIRIFRCRQPTNDREKEQQFLPMEDGTFNPNCNMSPGALAHAGELNPRTAVMIDANNMVTFLYIEGRDKRGPGMNLVQLADYCVTAGAVKAVNLDGGGSSQLIWRALGDTVIYQSNPQHDFGYPVGSILSLTKK